MQREQVGRRGDGQSHLFLAHHTTHLAVPLENCQHLGIGTSHPKGDAQALPLQVQLQSGYCTDQGHPMANPVSIRSQS